MSLVIGHHMSSNIVYVVASWKYAEGDVRVRISHTCRHDHLQQRETDGERERKRESETFDSDVEHATWVVYNCIALSLSVSHIVVCGPPSPACRGSARTCC